jgi:hypothetical protein
MFGDINYNILILGFLKFYILSYIQGVSIISFLEKKNPKSNYNCEYYFAPLKLKKLLLVGGLGFVYLISLNYFNSVKITPFYAVILPFYANCR